ncbi:hypothetical protein ACFWXO_43275 [Kitasatospora sp. NPDC059088]|uniref:hypothetical protein n=1 Tax=Kitasatospora sp. NPDC059088 TaxID=3346722 RepID=UPI003680FAC0
MSRRRTARPAASDSPDALFAMEDVPGPAADRGPECRAGAQAGAELSMILETYRKPAQPAAASHPDIPATWTQAQPHQFGSETATQPVLFVPGGPAALFDSAALS